MTFSSPAAKREGANPKKARQFFRGLLITKGGRNEQIPKKRVEEKEESRR